MFPAVSLEFSGPFSWLSSDLATSIFEAAAARAAWIYLWTVETQDGYVIYYVGETGAEFRQRMRQHWCEQMAGMYTSTTRSGLRSATNTCCGGRCMGTTVKPVLPRSWSASPRSHQPWLTSSDSCGSTSPP